MKMICLVLLSLLQITSTQTMLQQELKHNSHRCQYTPPNQNEFVNAVKIDPLPPGFRSRRQSQNNFRIHYEYTTRFNNYTEASQLKAEVTEPARIELEQMFRARSPINGILRVDRQCISSKYRVNANKVRGCAFGCVSNSKCGGITVPDKFLKQCKEVKSDDTVKYSESEGEGIVNKDMILLVDYVSCGASTLAYAAACFLEETLDRPILGIIGLCSDYFVAGRNAARNRKVVQHEIIHNLGFAVDKYAFYRYPNGIPMTARDKVGLPALGFDSGGFYKWNTKNTAKEVNRIHSSIFGNWQKSLFSLILPNVVKAARIHFNCSTLDSVDLEDPGYPGSSFSHFDELVFYDELMTPQNNGFSDPLSIMTLALLFDTGWYIIDCAAAQKLEYGANSGCKIPLSGCYDYMKEKMDKKQTLTPFCDKIVQHGDILSCSNDKIIQLCSMGSSSISDSRYSYFPNSSRGGVSLFAEYCPMIDKAFDCTDSTNDFTRSTALATFSEFGLSSRCFLTDWHDKPNMFYGAVCLKIICPSVVLNKYDVMIQGKRYGCEEKAQINITVLNTTATLTCPLIANMCGLPTKSSTTMAPEQMLSNSTENRDPTFSDTTISKDQTYSSSNICPVDFRNAQLTTPSSRAQLTTTSSQISTTKTSNQILPNYKLTVSVITLFCNILLLF